MYIVNGFICIGATLVLLGFRLYYLGFTDGQGQMIKSYDLAFIQELNGESYSGMVRPANQLTANSFERTGLSER